MVSIISIRGLTKTYEGGLTALSNVDLEIEKGEILALLGPNGAGKTTMIGIVCGLVTLTAGSVEVDGHDITRQYRQSRRLIGLVPQELHTDAFETVWNTVTLSRGLFGKRRDPGRVEKVLRDLSLYDKKDAQIITLSGGMKRRVMIAKALSHEPRILFLDEPTAGVDVELRKEMWALVEELRQTGVTVILTTHYIEEAEAIADRVGIINKGRLIVVDEKDALMAKLGRKNLRLRLAEPLQSLPDSLAGYGLEIANGGDELVYAFETTRERTGVTRLLNDLREAGLTVCDLETRQSSLEDIFVDLVKENA